MKILIDIIALITTTVVGVFNALYGNQVFAYILFWESGMMLTWLIVDMVDEIRNKRLFK